MSTVFLLHHVHELDDGHEDVKLIGVFSTEPLSRAGQQRVAHKPGFRELPEGFDISDYHVDGIISWQDGYITILPGEE